MIYYYLLQLGWQSYDGDVPRPLLGRDDAREEGQWPTVVSPWRLPCCLGGVFEMFPFALASTQRA